MVKFFLVAFLSTLHSSCTIIKGCQYTVHLISADLFQVKKVRYSTEFIYLLIVEISVGTVCICAEKHTTVAIGMWFILNLEKKHLFTSDSFI
jgi:hypothetical protein